MSRWLTPCKPTKIKVYKEYWDFPNMVESIKSSKKSPKNFLTPIFARKYKGFRNFHKDALGREKKSSKMGTFSTPPKPLLDGQNIGNSVLLWCWVKSIYDRGKILHFGYKKYTNKSLYRWCFQCFSFVLWEKYWYLFTMYYTRVDMWCQQLFQNFFYSTKLSNF